MSANDRRAYRFTVAGLAVAMAAGVTACNSNGSTGSSTTTGSVSTTTVGSGSGSVPSQTQLQSGLLSLAEAGAPFDTDNTANSDSTTDSVTGCDALNNSLFKRSGPGVVQGKVVYDGGTPSAGVDLSMALASEPSPQFDTDAASIAKGLQTCSSFTVQSSSGGGTLNLTPDTTDFPSGATADKFTSTVSGTTFDGYLVVQQIDNAELIFLLTEQSGAPTADAPSLFSKEVQKAQSALGGSSSNGSSSSSVGGDSSSTTDTSMTTDSSSTMDTPSTTDSSSSTTSTP